MKYYFACFLICLLFLTSGLSAVFSYPIFSSSGTLTENQHSYINDANESEHKVTTSAPKLTVVSLNWFNTVDAIFERDVATKIVDVQTGTVFYVKRTGGHYHADIEPIDKENMLKFHGIYNNLWSWERRPVWVEIKGIWIAASINGMPHGYSLIENNGLDGHTCLHFLNSKTHGTKRVDERHQDAISYALANGDKINDLNF